MKAREYYVAMGNDLIQKGTWSLSTLECKLMLYMVSKIKPTDEPYTEYPFTIGEFIRICKMNTDGGRSYKYVRDALVSLKSTPLIIHLDEKRELITNWFNDAEIDKESGVIKITFPHKLTPYLFCLQKKYTQFLIDYAVELNNNYTIKLFALLHSKMYKDNIIEVGIEELKKEMECYKYTLYKDFRRYVLEPALEDINLKTDIYVKYEPIKRGTKIVSIQFSIIQRNDSYLPF